jgi:hypothetical protein
LNSVSEKLSNGGGTVPKLINDPHIYDSVNDILIGIDDSWMLRWLIRNRQKTGIKHRYHEARDEKKEEEGEGRAPAPRTSTDEKQSEKPDPTPPALPPPAPSNEPGPPAQSTEPPPSLPGPVL